MLKIASWNINSVRLRLPSLKKILEQYNLDVICLQETKTPDEFFPEQDIKSYGYEHIAFRGEKSYNGVTIISRIPIVNSFHWDMCAKGDKRHIAVELDNGITIHNFYIPAGGDIADIKENPKFAHKLDFVDEMTSRFEESIPKKTVIVGDFNIAPFEHDVWSHKQLLKVVSHTPIEVEKLTKLSESQSWIDSHREFTPLDQKLYSWWSYRSPDWQKSNRGRRLDHIWLTPDLKQELKSADIYSETRSIEKPSDHATISITLNL